MLWSDGTFQDRAAKFILPVAVHVLIRVIAITTNKRLPRNSRVVYSFPAWGCMLAMTVWWLSTVSSPVYSKPANIRYTQHKHVKCQKFNICMFISNITIIFLLTAFYNQQSVANMLKRLCFLHWNKLQSEHLASCNFQSSTDKKFR